MSLVYLLLVVSVLLFLRRALAVAAVTVEGAAVVRLVYLVDTAVEDCSECKSRKGAQRPSCHEAKKASYPFSYCHVLFFAVKGLFNIINLHHHHSDVLFHLRVAEVVVYLCYMPVAREEEEELLGV